MLLEEYLADWFQNYWKDTFPEDVSEDGFPLSILIARWWDADQFVIKDRESWESA